MRVYFLQMVHLQTPFDKGNIGFPIFPSFFFKLGLDIMRNELKILSFKDFCIRREEVYSLFWVSYAPFFDIADYRDYLLYEVPLAKSKERQIQLAGIIWEYLMGDMNDDELINYWIHLRHGYEKKN